MDLSALQPLLAAMAGVRVACVGDVMLDRYVQGEVERISPEAPVPVLRMRSQAEMLGAAGNVARNVAALGGRPVLAGVKGAGPNGATLATLMAQDGIDDHTVSDAGRPTTVKTRFVAGQQQLLRLDEENLEPLSIVMERTVAEAVETAVRDQAVVLVSDYAKGAVTAATLEAARSGGAPVIVDPKGRDFAQYGRVALLKPNALELAGATGLPTRTDAEVEAALALALAGCEAEAVLVTRAGQGMSLARRGEPVRHFRARPREVFDVSGAGDTSLAAIGLALGAGASLEQAVELAILASGVVVEKAGTAVVTPSELIDAELAQHLAPADGKIATPEEAVRRVAEWRAQGLRIRFTNGCFDILHRGHVAYLAQARSWCDRLVLGLNTDDSIRRLKGPERPVNDLESRALVLGGLSSVDLIVPFGEDTPMGLIQALRPEVLVKGSDYSEAEVVGAAEVRGWGGEVKLADIVEGHSTTAAIARLRAAS
jgi:D-beta-D-heptose 7-phosphate kinase/D-beta-D-heptose 1-phosphate adenosyltransferase